MNVFIAFVIGFVTGSLVGIFAMIILAHVLTGLSLYDGEDDEVL